MPTPKEFGAEVTRMRLARGWTQDQAGAALGMGKAAVAAVEAGKTHARPYVVAGFRAILRENAP
jgi:transcriptional regulator with XRE-family HTH domain